MIGKLILIFIILPLIDLYLLLELAGMIGALETLGIVILTGIIGGFLAKTQGVQTLRRIRYRIRKGESPSRDLADGGLILVGAALLATPGLITDGIGFLLLLPVTRPFIRNWIIRYLKKKAKSGSVVIETNVGEGQPGFSKGGGNSFDPDGGFDYDLDSDYDIDEDFNEDDFDEDDFDEDPDFYLGGSDEGDGGDDNRGDR